MTSDDARGLPAAGLALAVRPTRAGSPGALMAAKNRAMKRGPAGGGLPLLHDHLVELGFAHGRSSRAAPACAARPRRRGRSVRRDAR